MGTSQGQTPPEDSRSDAELVTLALAGKREAETTLYNRHAQRLFAHLGLIVRNDHDIQDISQNIWLNVLTHLYQYNSARAPFVMWLEKIARNEMSNYFRNVRRKEIPGEKLNPATASRSEGRSPSVPTPEEAAELAEWVSCLKEALDALKELRPEDEEAIRLSFYEGIRLQGIAERQGVQAPAVWKRIQRALSALRDLLPAAYESPLPDPSSRRHQATDPNPIG